MLSARARAKVASRSKVRAKAKEDGSPVGNQRAKEKAARTKEKARVGQAEKESGWSEELATTVEWQVILRVIVGNQRKRTR